MGELFCTIITGVCGTPHRYYNSEERALRAAQQRCRRTGEAVEVAWCRHHGNPKVWLAFVTPDGTTRTQFAAHTES